MILKYFNIYLCYYCINSSVLVHLDSIIIYFGFYIDIDALKRQFDFLSENKTPQKN